MEHKTRTAYIVFDGRRYTAYSSQNLAPESREGFNAFRDKLEEKLTKQLGYNNFEYLSIKPATPAKRGKETP